MNRIHTLKLSIAIGLIALFAHTAEAASLFLVPGSGEFRTGGKITVDLKIDSEDSEIKRALELGANDYFVKSQHPIQEVIDKVREYLVGKGASRAQL